MTPHAVPIGGELWTRQYKALAAFAGLGIMLMLWRFIQGLGATTGLNDGHPWGIWIAFDVVTGTALGCGGYAVAILVYLLNKGRYTRWSARVSSPALSDTRWQAWPSLSMSGATGTSIECNSSSGIGTCIRRYWRLRSA